MRIERLDVEEESVEPENLLDFVKEVKRKFEHLSFITAIEYENFKLIYHFYSYEKKKHFSFFTEIPKENPKISSISSLWKGAEFLERETFDFFGIEFEGNPNLRRILLPDHWNIYPLRKSYIPKKEPMDWDKPIPKPRENELLINMGPQHPSTHGVCRLLVKIDQEIIQEVTPIIGYMHRSMEKLSEMDTYEQFIHITDRMDWLAGMTNEYAYVRSIEELMGLEIPQRAEYIRVICMELSRIAAHLMGIGAFTNDIGCFFSPLLYMLREREMVLDLFNLLCGQRLTFNYMRVGGVLMDIPFGFERALMNFIRKMYKMVDEYHDLLTGNEIFMARSIGTGILTKKDCLDYCATGPVARGSGIDFDARRDDSYSVYEELDFEVPVFKEGDVYSRYLVRMEEIRQSARIIEEALEMMPSGDVRAQVKRKIYPPVGEIYTRIEAPKGELGFYVVSNGSAGPYRVKVRSPSFSNVFTLIPASKGIKIPDLIITFGSLDTVVGEIDR
ncbi:MAG: NADH-quinone oxidoreductase subunit C [Candidatus Methanofastidiosia archaeon]